MTRHQVVEVAENVDAEEGGADGQDVEVELVVWQNTGVSGGQAGECRGGGGGVEEKGKEGEEEEGRRRGGGGAIGGSEEVYLTIN